MAERSPQRGTPRRRAAARGRGTASRGERTPSPRPSPTRRPTPSTGQSPREGGRGGRGRGREGGGLSLPLLILATIGCAAAIVVGALFVLAHTSLFAITSVDAVGTSHISAQDIKNLAAIPEGSSVLGLDTEAVRSRVSQNPWVAEVTVESGLDGHVAISVTERVPYAIVVMDSGEVAWYLSEDGVWLEPAEAKPIAGRTIFQVALDEAQSEGILLITGVLATVNPTAGAACTDAPILGALEYQTTFDEELRQQVAYYDASQESAISCVLKSGIEVSLGAPKDIAAKNTVILTLLEQYPNRLTYINVRVPSRPTYRIIDSDRTAPGTGLYGGSDTDGGASDLQADQSTDDESDTLSEEGSETEEEEG